MELFVQTELLKRMTYDVLELYFHLGTFYIDLERDFEKVHSLLLCSTYLITRWRS